MSPPTSWVSSPLPLELQLSGAESQGPSGGGGGGESCGAGARRMAPLGPGWDPRGQLVQPVSELPVRSSLHLEPELFPEGLCSPRPNLFC